jgi:DUF4097 and DUF4098 domain-containing protein YvlB
MPRKSKYSERWPAISRVRKSGKEINVDGNIYYKKSTSIRTFITLLIVLFVICCTKVLAQDASTSCKEPAVLMQTKTAQLLKPAPLPKASPSVQAPKAPQSVGGNQTIWDKERKLEPGRKVAVRNYNGSTTIIGWDRDIIMATASNDSGVEIPVKVTEEASGRVMIVPALEGRRSNNNIILDVRLPHYAEVESIGTAYGDIEVSGIDGSVRAGSGNGNLRISKVGSLSAATGKGDISIDMVGGRVTITTGSGDIDVSRVGSLEACTRAGDVSINGVGGAATVQSSNGSVSARGVKGDLIARVMSGDVDVENVSGLVNALVTSGDLVVSNTGGDVRAVLISGDTSIRCVKGRADINSASGSITLTSVNGDVDAVTVSGDVSFTGEVHTGGRYRMKSTSGEVYMVLPADSPGFVVTLSSYNGNIETAFPIKIEPSMPSLPEMAKPTQKPAIAQPVQRSVNRRIFGRYGDGQTQITLDSFSGSVHLKKASKGKTKECNK